MQQYFGSKVSLITNSDLIYHGTLYAIQSEEQTIGLRDVYPIGSDGTALSPYAAQFQLFKASELQSIYLHQTVNSTAVQYDITAMVLKNAQPTHYTLPYYNYNLYQQQQQPQQQPQQPQIQHYAKQQHASTVALNQYQNQQMMTTFSTSTVDMNEFENDDFDGDSKWALDDDCDQKWAMDEVVEMNDDDCVSHDVVLDDECLVQDLKDIHPFGVDDTSTLSGSIFDALDDVLDIEYNIQNTCDKQEQSKESKPIEMESNKAMTLSDAYFGFETPQNTTNFVYNVSNDEVLVRLSGFKFYGGPRLTITDDKSTMKITHIGGGAGNEKKAATDEATIVSPQMPLMRYHEYQQPNQEWNTCYGSFFIRSAHKNKIEMRVNQVCGSIPYGVCIGIVDGDTNDKSDGFHFGDRECYGFRSDGVQYTNGKLVGKWDKYCSGDSLALLVYNNTIQWLVNNVIKCIQYNIVSSRKYRLAVSMCGRNNSVTVLSASKIENAQTVLKKKK
eukprot:246091_1